MTATAAEIETGNILRTSAMSGDGCVTESPTNGSLDVPGKRAWTRRPHRSSYVYFIQAWELGLIKIGFARDPSERIYRLQIGSPDRLRLLAVIEDDQGLERLLHDKFAADRSHGEWFRPSASLLSYIAHHAEDFDALLRRQNDPALDRLHSGAAA